MNAEEYWKKANKVSDLYNRISHRTGQSTDAPCRWDVGASVVGPGGPTGKYVRQCKKTATTTSPAGLCLAHERMMRRIQMRDYTVKALRLSGKLRRSSADLGTVDPRAVLVTIKEWNALTEKPDFTTDAVYTLEDALMSKSVPSKAKEKPPKKKLEITPPKKMEITPPKKTPKQITKITKKAIESAVNSNVSPLEIRVDDLSEIITNAKNKKAIKQVGHVLFLKKWFIDENGDFVLPDKVEDYVVWSKKSSYVYVMKFTQLKKFYEYIRTPLPSSYTLRFTPRYEPASSDCPEELYKLVKNSATDKVIQQWYSNHDFNID